MQLIFYRTTEGIVLGMKTFVGQHILEVECPLQPAKTIHIGIPVNHESAKHCDIDILSTGFQSYPFDYVSNTRAGPGRS